MPGIGCHFYWQGRCVHGEYQNPGLNLDTVCLVLSRLEHCFDAFLDQWDQAGLELEADARIWQSWAGQTVDWDCPDYALDPEGASDLCAFFMQGLCLLRFPLCQGRCRHYELARGSKLEGAF